MQVISIANWNNGVWHVRAEWHGIITVVFEADRFHHPLIQIFDCLDYVREMEGK